MDELEQRLRSALTELAEEVPPSHHAWDEQQRRLALKSRRDRLRPALMAAVAAAVVALIAVPVVIFNTRSAPSLELGAVPLVTSSPGSSPAFPTQSQQTRVGYLPLNGETLTTDPLAIGNHAAGAKDRGQPPYVYTYTIRNSKGQFLCFSVIEYGKEINGPDQAKYGPPSCTPLTRPKNPGNLNWGSREAPFVDDNNGTFVYVMSKPADNLMLRDAASGRYVLAQQKNFGEEFGVFVAYMDSRTSPAAWTARDVNNKILQNGP
ncbi:MAG: hypothetical protein ABW224_25075 [Kibdelosporangium sp.]